jgi:hypothetical protein
MTKYGTIIEGVVESYIVPKNRQTIEKICSSRLLIYLCSQSTEGSLDESFRG